jgi:hypothetical protein
MLRFDRAFWGRFYIHNCRVDCFVEEASRCFSCADGSASHLYRLIAVRSEIAYHFFSKGGRFGVSLLSSGGKVSPDQPFPPYNDRPFN